MNKCGYIVSRQWEVIGFREDGYLAECILPKGHSGHHVIQTPEGKCWGWEYDEKCACEDCISNIDPCDRCYLYWEIAQEDERFLQKNRE